MDFELLNNEPMSKHTTFKVGGNASKYYKVKTLEGLVQVMNICKEEGQKPLIIGNGSNLLVSDKGIDGSVIEIGNGFDSIQVNGNEMVVEAGAMLSKVSKVAMEHGLSGLEFASGIPGTIGGAVFMNAGAYGGEMKDVLISVKALVDGEIVDIPAEDMKLSYRHSYAMEKDMVITGVLLRLKPDDKSQIENRMNDFNTRRREKQPLEYPSAGSTFKRPEGYFAGKLIMDSGLAGKSIGGAMVSPKHCGFVINNDNATASDIYKLICYVQSEVSEKFNVNLETEVRIIGDFEE
ncbi:MAG: UDP-N-acetylmuramate dehydrogenase [Eubacterium sp.]|nr:UDP-N-acetylmuramate dehydrogenase [Eubacterium sp.]